MRNIFQGSFVSTEQFFQASFQGKGSFHEKAASEEAASLLSVDQFCQDDFICPLTDVVHPSNPGHLIVRLQYFIDAFCLSHPGDDQQRRNALRIKCSGLRFFEKRELLSRH